MNTDFVLKETAFFGRPYEELLRCFGLSENELKGRRVLDCPAGPDSFVAEGLERGIDVTGVDPMYYRSPNAIDRLARSEFKDMYRKVRESQNRFVARTYDSIDESELVRNASLEKFLEHYRRTYPNGKYVAASLPELPFADNSFDVTICGHLFFIYGNLFDEEFHRRAVRELVRVTRRELRIHPLVGIDGKLHVFLEAVRKSWLLLVLKRRSSMWTTSFSREPRKPWWLVKT